MSYYEAEATAVIPAPPTVVYAIIADYQVGHPAIVPPQYFEKLVVREGGRGAGTLVDVHMNVMGVKNILQARVTEPEPGRVLVEDDPDAGVKTTFTVDPVDDGRHARVTIHTRARVSGGLRGAIEKRLNPLVARRIFEAELKRLADYAARQKMGAG